MSKKKRSRMISLIMILCLLLSAFPAASYGEEATEVLELAVSTAEIVAQPTDAEAAPGEDATFRIGISNMEIPAYQWESKAEGETDWEVLEGANKEELTLFGVTLEMSGQQYRCLVTEGECVLKSDAAVLTVKEAETEASTAPVKLVLSQAKEVQDKSDFSFSVKYSDGEEYEANLLAGSDNIYITEPFNSKKKYITTLAGTLPKDLSVSASDSIGNTYGTPSYEESETEGKMNFSMDISGVNYPLEGQFGASVIYLSVKDESNGTSDYTLIIDNLYPSVRDVSKETGGDYYPTAVGLKDETNDTILGYADQILDFSDTSSKVKMISLESDTKLVSGQIYRKTERNPYHSSNGTGFMTAGENYIRINGGEISRFEASNGDQPFFSRPLALKKGINVIEINAFNKTAKLASNNSGRITPTFRGKEGYAFLVSWNGEEAEPAASTNTDLEYVSAVSWEQLSNAEFKTYAAGKDSGGQYTVYLPKAMSYSRFLLGLVPKDPAAEISISDDNDLLIGNAAGVKQQIGMYRGLRTSVTDASGSTGPLTSVSVLITAGDRVTTTNHVIHIKYASGECSMTSLGVSGGNLFNAFSPTAYAYTVTIPAGMQEVTYQPAVSEGATVTINGKAPGDSGYGVVAVSDGVTTITVTAEDTVTRKTYTFVHETEGVGSSYFGIPAQTKALAKSMLTGWYGRSDAEKKDMTADYWALYKSVATGVSLDGAYVYDVTKHSFKQATDYAAVILELVLIGENPYDFGSDHRNYVSELMSLGGSSFGPYANSTWALMALKAAGADYDSGLVTTVKNQAANEDYDLDTRGWALAAVADLISPAERAALAESLNKKQMTTGADAGMYQYYSTVNINTHACVMTGITGANIDVERYAVSETQSPLKTMQSRYLTSDGKFIYNLTYGESGRSGSWNKDAVVALGDIVSGSNVWQRYALTYDKFEALCQQAADLAASDKGSEAQRTEISDALTAAKDAALANGETIKGLGDEYYRLYEAMAAIQTNLRPNVTMGDPVDHFEELVIALPEATNIVLTDKSQVEAVQDVYEKLSQSQKESISPDLLTKYRNCQGAVIRLTAGEGALDAFQKLSALPDAIVITLSDKTSVTAARKAYDALKEEQKAMVLWAEATLLTRLTEAEGVIAELEAPSPVGKTMSVTISILGGEKHGGSSIVYVYKKNQKNYDAWVPKITYTFNASTVSVYQVFMRAINEYGLDQKGAQNNYVRSIKGPDGVWLGEFDNGKYSGWMYAVNGMHPNLGLKEWDVKDGDDIVWHYTDDYNQEEGSEKWTSSSSSETSVTVELKGKTDAAGKASVSVSAKDITAALASVKAGLSASNKENTTGSITLDINTDSNAISVETALPTSAIKQIANTGTMKLTVKTQVGDVTYDAEALASMAAAAAGSEIRLLVGKANGTKLTEAQRKASSNMPVFELSAVSSGGQIIDFKKGTVTAALPYTPKKEEKTDHLRVFYLNNQGALFLMEGSDYKSSIGRITFTTNHFSYYAVGYQSGLDRFADVNRQHWFYENIMYLADKGIVKGKTETSFAPGSNITRADFVQLLYGMAQSSVASPDEENSDIVRAEAVFKDVKGSDWYAKAIAWAHAKGIVSGIKSADGTVVFAPDQSITRQDLAVMLSNYAEKIDRKTMNENASALSFQDKNAIAGYAAEAVEQMQRSGIINGVIQKSNSGEEMTLFRPKEKATRAESATMVAKYLKII